MYDGHGLCGPARPRTTPHRCADAGEGARAAAAERERAHAAELKVELARRGLQRRPARVASPRGSSFTRDAAAAQPGGRGGCRRNHVLARTEDGKIFSWGMGGLGLGQGSRDQTRVPKQIVTGVFAAQAGV